PTHRATRRQTRPPSRTSASTRRSSTGLPFPTWEKPLPLTARGAPNPGTGSCTATTRLRIRTYPYGG
ncbi:hypothetical protein E4U42_002685, partial [Claviceps africana]